MMNIFNSTSLLEISISTAKLVMWLHWQLMWLLFLLSTSQPLEDQPPVPPILKYKDNNMTACHLQKFIYNVRT